MPKIDDKYIPRIQCPKCNGDIIWLQKQSDGGPYRGCRNWIVCDYQEPIESYGYGWSKKLKKALKDAKRRRGEE